MISRKRTSTPEQTLWMTFSEQENESSENEETVTGKSLLEALILASTNPQYEKRLLIDLPVQYMKTTSSEHVVYSKLSIIRSGRSRLLEFEKNSTGRLREISF